MEEQVGYLWHRLVTRAAGGRHPEAAVQLTELAPTLGILFRALRAATAACAWRAPTPRRMVRAGPGWPGWRGPGAKLVVGLAG